MSTEKGRPQLEVINNGLNEGNSSKTTLQSSHAAVSRRMLGIAALSFVPRPVPCVRLQEIFDNILERRIEWPEDLTPGCRDLIDRLLCSDPTRRLGSRGATEVFDLLC